MTGEGYSNPSIHGETTAHRRTFGFYLLLFGAAFLIRLVYLFELPANPLFDNIPSGTDHYNFDLAATHFATGDWLARSPNNSFAPLYKYFLGILYLLFGRNFYFIYGVQFALGALAAVLMYRIGAGLFSHRAGLLAYLGFALHTTEIIYEGILLRAAFITFCGVLSLYMLMRLEASARWSTLVAATLSLSLFFQGRPNTLLCLPLVCVFLHQRVFVKWPAHRVKAAWTVFTATLILSFLPLLIQCYIVHGRFVLFDASGSHALISGNLIEYAGVGFDNLMLDNYIRSHRSGYAADLPFLITHILDNPWEFLKLYFRKVYFLFNDFESPSNASVYLYRQFSSLLPYLLNHFAIFSSLGLIGAVLAWRSKRGNSILLFYYLASLSLAVLIFINVDRYRLPVVPYFILSAAFALERIWHWLEHRRFKSAGVTAAVALLLFWGFQEPAGMQRIRGNDYGILGDAYWMRGDSVKATATFKQSLDMDPANPHTRINLGTMYVRAGAWAQAEEQFAAAVQLRPDLWEAHFNLGLIYQSSGRIDPAERAFETVLRLNPTMHPALDHLAMIRAEQGRHEETIRLLLSSLQIEPRSAEAYFRLGVAYVSAHMNQRAIEAFTKAVEINPGSAEGYNNLGAVYDALGRYREAETALAEAVRLQPEFASARANLEAVRQKIQTPR
jgi:Flp pilus assembly protein TadD/4-amino-4-deoxy-L-arabinose transferase-like glycosyltransferase